MNFRRALPDIIPAPLRTDGESEDTSVEVFSCASIEYSNRSGGIWLGTNCITPARASDGPFPSKPPHFNELWRACPCFRRQITCLRVRNLHLALMAALLIAVTHFDAIAQERNSPQPPADTSGLDFHQFGLLAVQDGGRRKPIDTFSRETLIRVTGRSTYTDKAGHKWQTNDFIFSAVLETHDWRTEPMVLVSLGQLKERLGLDKTERHFSFEKLVALTELQRLTNEAHALKRAEKTLDRVQQEALAVSDRLALLANVMNGSALLIVPASKSETDPWVIPPEFSRYYSETQFAPVQIELQTMATSYVQADGFNFSRAASRLRESLRALSPSVYPPERQLRLEYFYNHFEAFYRAIWFYGLAFLVLLVAHARGGAAAGDEYVRVDHLGVVRSFIFRDDLFRALPDIGLFARRVTGHIDRAVISASNADRDAVKHRSAGASIARQFLADRACVDDHAQLRCVRAGHGLRPHLALALRPQSSGRAGGRADAFLALSRPPARRLAPRGRNNSWRGLGELFLGPVLGLGPKRNLGADCVALLPDDFAWTTGRVVD